MATYRPVKKWLIPLMAIIIGGSAGFYFFPSAHEYHYAQWMQMIEEAKELEYKVEGKYSFNDQPSFTSEGIWSEEKSFFTIFSERTDYFFHIFIEENVMFVDRQGDWRQASRPHQVFAELSPLDHPFNWTVDMLSDAAKVNYEEDGNQKKYEAIFHEFHHVDVMGYELREQRDTRLEMVFEDNKLSSLIITIKPVRHDEIKDNDKYPEVMEHLIFFEVNEKQEIRIAPEYAHESAEMESLYLNHFEP
ncbi:hypothetical protein Bcell_1338 [Evansella cellulosilytica DSM 2522]|uniref:Outer membrane lipoprotein-sorting protein n=2 Tax=Evansella TaxID=2837485 RepID=E6TTG7_EVAC2|nr:hypothetical protein Bcell_1338 [Evansella cellulosilytica DSM 2522]